jgi:hypothetical protein
VPRGQQAGEQTGVRRQRQRRSRHGLIEQDTVRREALERGARAAHESVRRQAIRPSCIQSDDEYANWWRVLIRHAQGECHGDGRKNNEQRSDGCGLLQRRTMTKPCVPELQTLSSGTKGGCVRVVVSIHPFQSPEKACGVPRVEIEPRTMKAPVGMRSTMSKGP